MTGKIIRARPRYLEDDFFKDLSLIDQSEDNKELFFNTGRSALKLLLIRYSQFYNKRLTVALQSFNCSVVMEAALQANCNIILFDIKLSDLSIDFETLRNNYSEIDVLLLTHYQGIPNFQYIQIADFCLKKKILLIDDIAISEGSKIKNNRVGTLGNFAIRSFAFDKPYTSFQGGSLIINDSANTDKEFIKYLKSGYMKLALESKGKTCRDIQILKFLLKYTQPGYYHTGLNDYHILKFYIYLGNFKAIFFLSRFKMINKYLGAILRRIETRNIKIKRLRKEKRNLIRLQYKNFNLYNPSIEILDKLSLSLGLKPIKNTDTIINWNRYSIFDEKKILKNYLNNRNIEADNYTWYYPLHFRYKNIPHVKLAGSYENSYFASQNILNVPVWRKLDFN